MKSDCRLIRQTYLAYGYILPVIFLIIWVVFFMFLVVSSYYGFIDSDHTKGDIPLMGLVFIKIGFVLLFYLIRVPKRIEVYDNIVTFISPLRRLSLNISEIEVIEVSSPTSKDNIFQYIVYGDERKKLYLHRKYKEFDQFIEYLRERNSLNRKDWK